MTYSPLFVLTRQLPSPATEMLDAAGRVRVAESRAERVDFAEALRRADVLSIHTPLSSRTRHLIGATEPGTMKPTAIVVNTVRGPIIDESALVTALRAGTIAAEGLDEPHHAMTCRSHGAR